MKVKVLGLIQLAKSLGVDVTSQVKGLLPKQKCILTGKWVALKARDMWYIDTGGSGDWHGSMLGVLQEKHGESPDFVLCGTIKERDGNLTIRCEQTFPEVDNLKESIRESLLAARAGFPGDTYECDF